MDEQSLNELLECSVCLERLDHTSKVLPCQHTFCRRCLLEIVSTKRELRCPECRTVVDTPVNDLPSNILLIRLLEGIKTKNTERTRSPQRSDVDLHGLSAGGVRHIRQGLVGNQPCAKALFNYEGKDSGDLSFKKGDIIILKRQVDENWFHGEFNGQHGFFPATYVQELVPLPVTTPQCKALYDFDFENENEKKDCLCFKKDEILTVIKRVDDNWLEGKKGDKFGIFPISFVELNDAAKALIHSKSSNMHAVSGNHGNGDGALSSATNLLNPLAFAGQIPQKRHSFTATPVEPKPSSANKHYRRSLELSSKGNLVSLPLVTQAEQVPPPVPSHQSSSASSTHNSSSLSSVPSTSQAGSTRVPDYDVEQPGPPSHLVIAMFNYKPQKEDELELRKGDQYSVLEMCQDGWYKGQCLKSGKMGVFPGNYVQKTRGPSAFRPISNVQNVRVKGHTAPGSSTSTESSSAKGKHHLSYAVERPPDREARKSSSPARQSSASLRSSVSPQRSSQNAPPSITPRSSKISSVPSTSTSSSTSSSATSSSAANHKSVSAVNRAPPSGENQTQPHSGKSHHSSASSMPTHSRKGNNSSSADQNALVSLSSVPHSITATASGGSNGASVGATGETVPAASKEKQKEKKDKEKISLVKRLVSSGKSKKSKPVNDSTLAAAALDNNTNHTRSGSCPSETAPHSEGQHVKTGSFDSSTNTSANVPTKPNRPKPVIREKFRCREPYPPQSEIELELKVGDIVFVYKKREDGWFKGTLQRTGKTGLFPGSFVEKID